MLGIGIMKRKYFNMVEIALAMAIIAIGLSSILVLFPVGLNANKAAIADNNLADVAEYLMGYLRASAAADWKKNGSNTFLTTLPDNYSDVKNEKAAVPSDPESNAFKTNWQTFGSTVQNATRLYQNKNQKGVFLFRQISRITDPADSTKVIEISDFSAVIKVWKDDTYDFYFPEAYSTSDPPYKSISAASTTLRDELKKYATGLCLEMSWPAEIPLENRETRTFRFEIFNETYEVVDPATP